MLINDVKKMAERQGFGKSHTKVKYGDKNILEHAKALGKHNGKSRWQRLELQMRCKK